MFTKKDWLHSCKALTDLGLAHGWSDCEGPDFKSPTDGADHSLAVKELCQKVGLQNAAWAEQVHGGRVMQVDVPGLAGKADAIWTDQPQLGVIGRSADCPLILVGGPRSSGQPVVGFAHASWKSTVQGITGSLVAALTGAGALPEQLQAVICPSAGPCCYEVGEEVRDEACAHLGDRAAVHFHRREGRIIMDLWSANSDQLVTAGVNHTRIHWTEHCTICGSPSGDLRFPSYRRQGHLAGRFAAVIGFPG